MFAPWEWGAHLWPAVAGIAGVVLTYTIGNALFGGTVGLLASLVLATNIGYVVFARVISTDLLFTLWLSLTCFAFLQGYHRLGRHWLPLGLHFSWNFSQGPLLGFPVSGFDFGGLVTQESTGAALLTGGAYGPEAGLVGMAFRFVIMALVLYYLQLRCHGQGEIKSLTFPIKVYENPKTR